MEQRDNGLREKRDAAIRRYIAIVAIVALGISVAVAVAYTIIK